MILKNENIRISFFGTLYKNQSSEPRNFGKSLNLLYSVIFQLWVCGNWTIVFHIAIVIHQVATALTITVKYVFDCNVTNFQFSSFFPSVVIVFISEVREFTIKILQFFRLFFHLFFPLSLYLQCSQIDALVVRTEMALSFPAWQLPRANF